MEVEGKAEVNQHNNNEEGPLSIAWWSDFLKPQLLLRWTFTGCVFAFWFFHFTKNMRYFIILDLILHASFYSDKIFTPFWDAVRSPKEVFIAIKNFFRNLPQSAKEGCNAIKRFLRSLPEYEIW